MRFFARAPCAWHLDLVAEVLVCNVRCFALPPNKNRLIPTLLRVGVFFSSWGWGRGVFTALSRHRKSGKSNRGSSFDSNTSSSK